MSGTYKDFFCCDPVAICSSVVSEIVAPCHRLVDAEEESHDTAHVWVRVFGETDLSSNVFEVLVTCLNRARKVNESHKEMCFGKTKNLKLKLPFVHRCRLLFVGMVCTTRRGTIHRSCKLAGCGPP